MFQGQTKRKTDGRKPLDINELDEEIRATIAPQHPRDLDEAEVLPYAPKLPLPVYAQHIEGVDNIGRLSAEAIVQQYEAAAKQVEELGVETKEIAAKLTEALKECDEDMRVIAETAQAIRDKGKSIFIQIEDASRITTELRRTCIELKDKIK
ncbi:MAG TPA: hypothetical protein VHK86_08780 [Nitrososphaera sp.]|jgi:hypothetical protein|nr:hypothetical protein [Nitrososphaera sp.]HEX2614467.1 hypothetical protein [Nitrososphaera sp.]